MRRAALVLALALTAVLVTASGAVASPKATMLICGETAPFSAPFSELGIGFLVEDNCAFGGGLDIDNWGSSYGSQQAWQASGFPAELSIDSFSLDYSGGDTSTGVRYAIAPCFDCTPYATIDPRSVGDPPAQIVIDDPVAPAIFLIAECTNPIGCADNHYPITFNNIKINFVDDTPPTIAGSAVNGIALGDDGFLGWTNKEAIPATAGVTDNGVGVLDMSIAVGSGGEAGRLWDWSGQCSQVTWFSFARFCSSQQAEGGLIDVSPLADGKYDVTALAHDGVGNPASTAPQQLGIDRTVPAPPTGVELAYASSGWPGQRWTSNPNISLTWDPAPELLDPEIESPLDHAVVTSHRSGSSVVSRSDQPIDSTEYGPTQLATDGEWAISASFNDQAGNAGELTTPIVGLDRDAPNAPVIDAAGWISGPDLGSGRKLTWTEPAANTLLESGICGYVVRIDQSATSKPVFGTDETTTSRSWTIPANLPDGDNFAHVAAVSCAGVESEQDVEALHVDATAPELTVSGLTAPDTWSTKAQTARITATDSGSGVDAIGYEIDHGATVWAYDAEVSVDMPVGDHTLTVRARDVALNTSTGTSVKVLTDLAAPQVEFQSPSATDPTLVTASVIDPISGLGAVSLEIRRSDQGASSTERQWRTLGGAEAITRGTRTAVTLERRIDDATLANGDYEIRTYAIDLAGNSSIAGDFAIRSLHLPLRRAAEISAAIAEAHKVCRTNTGKRCRSLKRCPKRKKCAMVTEVDRDRAKSSVVKTWGERSALVGDALDAAGLPLAGVRVAISATPPFHEPMLLTTVTTDADGRYTASIPVGPSRLLTAQIDGNATQQPATEQARLNIRSDIAFDPSPRTLRSGNSLIFAGRVKHSDWLPVGGVSAAIQWLSPNGWVLIGEDMQTDASGKFSQIFPWRPVAKPTSAVFRVRVKGDAGWPFVEGHSPAVRIKVLPARR